LVCLPQPVKWLGIYQYKNKVKMKAKEITKETSLEYYHDKVLLFIIINSDMKGEFLIDSFYEAKKMYAEEIAKAFEKGYIQGVNYTDGLISEEKKFPF
jgi:hypothetical protein